MPFPTRRPLAALLATLGALAALPSLADSQTTIPTVTVSSAGGSKATVTGADALQSGFTQLQFGATTKKEVDYNVLALKPGVTVAQITAAAPKLKSADGALKYGTFITGATIDGGKAESFSVDLAPGTYAIAITTRKPVVVGSFTVGSGQNGVTAPTPDATINLKNYKVEAPATLPSTGIIAVHNNGMSLHFLVAIRAKKASDAKRLAAYLKAGKGKKAQPLIDNAHSGDLAPLLSVGVTSDVAVKGLKPGKWILACFFGDAASHGKEHVMLGMETVVTVK